MNQKITIIAALASDGAIGRGGRLLFRISEDMRRFRRLTMGKPLVMGRRTFESLPGALPGRRNIVVTRNAGYAPAGAETAPSLEAAIAMCAGAGEVMVIGGGQIYAECMHMATNLELTLVDGSVPDADTFFPAVDPALWQTEAEDGPHADSDGGVRYTYVSLKRR